MNALVIDDDAAVVSALSRALERASYSVVAVDNGLAAFAELGQREFGVIICDFRLPFLNGKKFFEQVLEEFPDMAQKIIWVTGFGADEEIGAFLNSTGRPVLTKPYELTELMTLVRDTASD